MKKFDDFLKPNYLRERKLNKPIQKLLRQWAMEAHEIDTSRPVSFYYNLFLERYKKQGIGEKVLKDAFGEDAIET